MQLRQIVTVIVALIAIVGAALFVVSWGGDDDTDTEGDDTTLADDTSDTETTDVTDDTSTTATTITTPPAPCVSGTGTTTSDDTAEETDTAEGGDGTSGEGGEVGGETDDEPTEPTLGSNSSVSTVGLDAVTFGLTVFQAERAAGTELVPCDPVADCYRVAPADAPEGIVFVVDEGTIERVDIVDGPVTTRSGIGIGTEETRIVELFGDSLERRVNEDSSVDLVFVPSSETDAEFRVIFTIRGGVVETFRSGRVPLVDDTVPCA